MSLCGLGINQSQGIPCKHGKFLLLECCFLCSIEAQIEALHKQCIELKTEYPNAKKPYKCPVCEGLGNDKGIPIANPAYEFSMKYASCQSCEGKGIVWG